MYAVEKRDPAIEPDPSVGVQHFTARIVNTFGIAVSARVAGSNPAGAAQALAERNWPLLKVGNHIAIRGTDSGEDATFRVAGISTTRKNRHVTLTRQPTCSCSEIKIVLDESGDFVEPDDKNWAGRGWFVGRCVRCGDEVLTLRAIAEELRGVGKTMDDAEHGWAKRQEATAEKDRAIAERV